MQTSLAELPDAVHVPDAGSLLDAWEDGIGQPPALRALTIVALTGQQPPRDAGALTVGERDRRLLELREALFGSRLDCVSACPACDEQVELSFPVSAILVAPSRRAPEHVSVTVTGDEIHARLPTAADLAALAQVTDRDPREELLARCLPADAGPLPAAAADALAAALAAADPQADVRLTLDCPSCEHRWSAPFDVANHLLGEVDVWAQHTLWDIHALARAYGWREADTLALSPTRRQFYLEAIGG